MCEWLHFPGGEEVAVGSGEFELRKKYPPARLLAFGSKSIIEEMGDCFGSIFGVFCGGNGAKCY
eukprot:scaffold200178_cov51-Attheya_sp.AAC.2